MVWNTLNEEITKVEFKLKGYDATIGVHLSLNDDKASSKDEHDERLRQLLDTCG